jgi:predicted TIM-barrel fold metal-dependent hydrolase
MNGKIALEEHFALEDTLEDAIYSRNFPAWPDMRRRLIDLHDLRLPEMDKYGIELMIMSLHNPAVQGIPEAPKAVAMAKRVNDTLAAAVAKRPDRFAGFATLPMQDPEAAIVELTRCIKDLGFKGAMVNGFSQVGSPDKVVYLDDLRYRPFWAKVEELNVPLYLHPRDPLPNREPIYEGHFWFMGSAWAFGVETAMHALRLMGSGLFDHYPKLNIILGHLGEGIPYSVWRLDHRISRTPRNIPAKRKMA